MVPGRARRRARTGPGLVLALSLAAVACGGGQPSPTPDPRGVLRQAKAAVDATASLHFTLTSKDAPASAAGTYITGGQGDARRPDSVTGSLQVVFNGLPLTLAVVSTGGTFYVRVPFGGGYAATDPSKYGFGDPGKLLDPQTGLSSLLVDATSAALDGRDRLGGEELEEVTVTLPGKPVATLLASSDPSQPVHGRVGIDPSTHQVRRVVLTGPFFDPHQPSTYTLILDRYGETVQITPPAGG